MKSILLFAEGTGDRKAWLALWLEKDLMSQGSTSHEALRSLQRTILAQEFFDKKDGREPFSESPPAPALYVGMYDRANAWSGDHPSDAVDWSIRITTEDTGARWVLVKDPREKWFKRSMIACIAACVLSCLLPAPWWYGSLAFAFVLAVITTIVFRRLLLRSV